jgi:thiol-disulfide isomerase/thioredoxin
MSVRNSLVDFGIFLLVAVLGLIVWQALSSDGAASGGVKAGTPMPSMNVDGWLNLAEGESFDPEGKIVVVDMWATWCGPCRDEMPRLAKVAAQYRPLGVEFVGLTSETERDVPRIEEFIASVPGFEWPVGYGAQGFWNALDIPGVPTVAVFGRDGLAKWSSVGSGQPGLEEALDELLAADRRAGRAGDDRNEADE